MSTQKRAGDYHVSSHSKGSWKDGAWHCAHGYRAWEDKAGPNSNYYMMRYWKCDPRKRTPNEDDCRFWLWEDHLPEAMKYHGVPEDAIKPTSPYKRKRDGDIRDWVTPKTQRTRDALGSPGHDLSGLYDTPTPSPPDRLNGGSSQRDSSPTPLPRRPRASGAPPPSSATADPRASQQVTPPLGTPPPPSSQTLGHSQMSLPSQLPSTGPLSQTQASAPHASPPMPTLPSQIPSTGPLTQNGDPSPAQPAILAPAPDIHAETPRRSTGRRLFDTPGSGAPLTDAPLSGARRLVTPELDAYNAVIKALAAANVKLSLRGQNTLREIIREDAYTIGREGRRG